MLLLIDANGYLHRAYHAHPYLTRASDGQPTGAVYGFVRMVFNDLRQFEHTHVAAVFDGKGGSRKRYALHPDYKGGRGERAPGLVSQYQLVRRAAAALSIACVEQEGWEADDLIATYAAQATSRGIPTTILSSDKDFMQLMRDDVTLHCPIKKQTMGLDDVHKKFGVLPHLVTAVQALQGDTVDNIPGVAGIGPKTAAALINSCGSLEAALAACSNAMTTLPISVRHRQKIAENADRARLSLQLATLDCAAPVVRTLDHLARTEFDPIALANFLLEMEFASLRSTLLGEVAA